MGLIVEKTKEERIRETKEAIRAKEKVMVPAREEKRILMFSVSSAGDMVTRRINVRIRL